ncbi:MAG: TerC family protein [Acidimicrobiales bacterium]|nr:TerC family protein [Acidimicrobiales bacterium]
MFPVVLAESSSRADHFASFDVHPWQWALFVGFIAVLIIADLLLVHRTAHEITFKEAAIESSVWIAIGVAFTGVIFAWHGGQAAGEYISGYLIEKSLSIDNVFVWAVIFSYFAVPKAYQFRTLFWGIFGALILRAIFIFAGVALIEAFEWVLAIFGLVLLYSAWKIATHDDQEVHPENNPVLKIVNRLIPSTPDYDGQKLFTMRNGRRLATPLLAVLIMVETTDVVFAVDSIPAILAVSHEQFIVFSSNAFAILGLRSLYFLLNGMQDKFRYLNVGLGLILSFVGLKMLASFFFGIHPPTWSSLVVISVLLTITMVASLAADKRDDARVEAQVPGGDEVVMPPATDQAEPGERPTIDEHLDADQ